MFIDYDFPNRLFREKNNKNVINEKNSYNLLVGGEMAASCTTDDEDPNNKNVTHEIFSFIQIRSST